MTARARGIAAGIVLAALCVAGVFAFARPVTLVVIVDRTDRAVELFIGLPARSLTDVFALPPRHLAGPDGAVDFLALRDGTWSIGDALFASLDARFGAAPVRFEATSLMVHPVHRRVPFDDPLDGLIALGVCGVTPPSTPPRLDALYAYSGHIAYVEDSSRVLELTFAKTGRAPILVDLRDFSDGRPIRRGWRLLMDGGSLVIGQRPGTDAPAPHPEPA